MVEQIEPLEMILPGIWRLSFIDNHEDITGEGEYTFKLAGTFNADVRDFYSGQSVWHGYWQIEDAQLVLNAREIDSRCSSCLGAGAAHNWTIELEHVHDDAFSGVLKTEDSHIHRATLFERVA